MATRAPASSTRSRRPASGSPAPSAGERRRPVPARPGRRPLRRARLARRARIRPRAGRRVWIDAHGDLNRPETSPTRQRARNGARGGARPRRPGSRATPGRRLPSTARASRSSARAARPGRARAHREYGSARLDDEHDRPTRAWSARCGRRSSTSPATTSSTSVSTWTRSTPGSHRASARRSRWARYREAHLALELVADANCCRRSTSSR